MAMGLRSARVHRAALAEIADSDGTHLAQTGPFVLNQLYWFVASLLLPRAVYLLFPSCVD